MAHTIGESVPVSTPYPAGTHHFSSARADAARWVVLHFRNVTLPVGRRLEVELGYDTDTFDGVSGTDIWTRPYDPRNGPVTFRIPAGGSAVLHEYIVGEAHVGLDPDRPNTSNSDPFLHTAIDNGVFQEPDYETTFICPPGTPFSWQNLRCADSNPVVRAAANAVCHILVAAHRHGSVQVASSCTGTLIGPDRILTAHHCFTEPDGIDWRSASACFNYETNCDGSRPTGYAPHFYKVTGVVARSRSQQGVGEWIILQIDVPPGGIAILPRELRTTPVMAGEPVFAIHHPHGSPKKYEAGAPSSPLRPGFDFAGGSSGSSIFDQNGRIIGGPLSNGGGCSAQYTAATTVLGDIAQPPVPAQPLDVVLVLDRSGSMSQTDAVMGESRLNAAKSAAALFVDLVRAEAGDRVGLVSYSNTARIDTPLQSVTAAHKNTLAGPANPTTGVRNAGAIGALAAGGSTSIGDGLQKAISALGGSPDNQSTILLMTDGLHNTPPAIESASLSAARLCAVGFGQDHEIDGSVLRRLSGRHRGSYIRAGEGVALHKFFALCFGDIFEAGTLADPDRTLKAKQEEGAWQSFNVCGETHITLVIGWDEAVERLEADIQDPLGRVIAPTNTQTDRRNGRWWWFVRVQTAASEQPFGVWRYRVRRRPAGDVEFPPPRHEVRYFTLLLARGGPRLTPRRDAQAIATGDPLRLAVGLFNPDETAPHAQVTATITAPDGALGAVALKAGPVAPQVDGDPLDGFRAAVASVIGNGAPPVPTRSFTVPLLDDGNQLDGSFERDGVYTARLDDATRFEGTYMIHARATYPCGSGIGTREAIWSVHVEPGIDPDRSEATILETNSENDGASYGVLRFVPRDRYGNPLGPNRPEYVNLTPVGATPVGPMRSEPDGSYEQGIRYPAGKPPTAAHLPAPNGKLVLIPIAPHYESQQPCRPTRPRDCGPAADQLLGCLGIQGPRAKNVRIKSVCLEVRLRDDECCD